MPSAAAKPDATPSQQWKDQITSRIAAGEYKLRPSAAASGLTAVNRSQQLRLSWTSDRVELEVSTTHALSSGATGPKALIDALSGQAGAQSATTPQSHFSMHTLAITRAKQSIAVQALGFNAGSCQKDGALDESGECLKRAENQQQGWSEWWENRPDGIEQGFDISARPLAAAAGAPLQIQIGIDGASAKVSDDGQSASFTTATGQSLSYAQLSARDVHDQALPIRLVAIAHGVALEVDDANATYPITVDPLLGTFWRGDQNQANSQYGFSVAGVGDVNGDGFADVVVGAPKYTNLATAEGMVFLYLGAAGGLSPSPSSWGARGVQPNSSFGSAVAAAGDVNGDGFSDIIVGAPTYPNGGQVYVFYGRKMGGLNSNADWSFPSDVADAQFGSAVAGAGDVDGDGNGDIIVGAPNYTGGGRVFIWHGSTAGLPVDVAKQTLTGGLANAKFGFSVASAGDVNGDGKSDVIVGAPAYTITNTVPVEGEVFIYLGSSTGIPKNPIAQPHGGMQGSLFGFSVAGAGDVDGDGYADVIVGQPGFASVTAQKSEGRVVIYRGGPAGLFNAATPQWAKESDNPLAQLGWSVASAGDVNADGLADVIAGAPFYSSSSSTSKDGRAFVYFGSSSTTIATVSAEINDGQPGSQYGASVGSAGDVNGDGRSDVIIGAPLFNNVPDHEGNAFVHYSNAMSGYADQFTSTAWPNVSGQAGAMVGNVSSAGDINGDGLGDVLVTYPNYQPPDHSYMGLAKLFLGTPNGPSSSPAATLTGDPSGTGPLSIATSAGDVNGDGFGDVIVTNAQYTNGEPQEGRALLYTGGRDGLTATAWKPEGNLQFAYFGWSAASAGDVNGDGFGDVVIGAMGYDPAMTWKGRVYLYMGSAAGLSNSPVFREINVPNAFFGMSVASAGDVNGDGYGDIIVGAPGYQNVEASEGKAFIYKGGQGGLDSTPSWQHESNNQGAVFGTSVASAGDVNGDGYDDVIVGAPSYTNAGLDGGAVFVFYGGLNGPDQLTANWQEFGSASGQQWGNCVSGAGDMNGDGYADILIGAAGFSQNAGAVFGIEGSATGVVSIASMVNVGPSGSAYGTTVANAGDVNGDGYSDAIVAAPYYSTSTLSNDGAAYVYLGNGNDSPNGLPIMPQTRRVDSTTPIVPGNKAFSTTSFDALLLKARGPTGRTRVKLEVEVKPLKTAFNGNGLLTSGWVDTTLAGVTLKQTITNANGGGATPHWRARLVYDPARGAAPFGRSHWFYGGALGRPGSVHVRVAP